MRDARRELLAHGAQSMTNMWSENFLPKPSFVSSVGFAVGVAVRVILISNIVSFPLSFYARAHDFRRFMTQMLVSIIIFRSGFARNRKMFHLSTGKVAPDCEHNGVQTAKSMVQ